MSQRSIHLFIIITILCGRENISSAQVFSIQQRDTIKFPTYLESNMGFIPVDINFENDSIFYVNTYYAGIYKFQISKNSLIIKDSFNLKSSHLRLFENSLQKLYNLKNKNYKYFIYSDLKKLGMPFQYAFSSSKIHINNNEVAVIYTLYFGESIDVNNKDSIYMDSVLIKKGTKVGMRSFLVILDTFFQIQSIYPVDRDSFYALPGSDRISSSFENEFFRNRSEIYSSLIYAYKEVNEKTSAAIKWKIYNGIIWPEKILNSLTLGSNTIGKVKNESWPGFSSNVHFIEKNDTLYAFQDNQVFIEYSKDSFVLHDLIKIPDSFTLSRVQLFNTNSFLIYYKFKKTSTSHSSISHYSYLYYPGNKFYEAINGANSFEGSYLNIIGPNVFTISTNNGSFFLNRYRLSTGTK